jgi:hypothetical protein
MPRAHDPFPYPFPYPFPKGVLALASLIAYRAAPKTKNTRLP